MCAGSVVFEADDRKNSLRAGKSFFFSVRRKTCVACGEAKPGKLTFLTRTGNSCATCVKRATQKANLTIALN